MQFGLRALTFLVLMLVFPLISRQSLADDAGWYGILDVGVREFRFFVQPKSENDQEKWQLVSLDEGDAKFDLDDVQITTETLSFQIRKTAATFEGRISADGQKADGRWKQRGTDFPLSFRKVEKRPEDKPSEIWVGDLSVLFQKLKIQFRVYRKADGSEDVRFDSLSQQAGGFKAVRTVKDGAWTVTVEAVKGTFEGKASADGKSVAGKWSQGGPQLDLILQRSETTPEPEKPKRPQTPVPPFPYTATEVKFPSLEEGVVLAGTLTVPKTPKPASGFPAAILISGSGPQDRDETLLDHKPFAVIADALTRRGICVLRFDDRGTAESTGDFAKATSENFASDVEGAIRFLKTQKGVNAKQIGLIGHSEGGLIAPMVSVRNSDVAWIVLLAGPAVNGAEILKSQGRLIAQAEGITDTSVLDAQTKSQDVLISLVLQNPKASAEELLPKAMEQLADMAPKEESKQAEFKAELTGGLKELSSPWFRFFLVHDPGAVLEKVTCPVLALNGEKDTQVDPKLNLPRLRDALKKAGNDSSAVEEIPGVNHLFQTCRTGGVSEYNTIEETVAPAVLTKVADWIFQKSH
ncbi:MAG: alpha/beta hydrolase [Planctomycetaceae bacterium]|nr:alpha/beta hydrolase [Planctomycetaceae bacterium]